MEINKYIQGKNDNEIFCSLGAWITNKQVQDDLGMAITSQDGDIWYISSMKNITTGFAVQRTTKSTNAIHIRFVYSDIDTKKRFIETIIKEAKELGISSVWTNDRKREMVWKTLGFSFTARARGEFGRWEIVLNNTKGVKS